MPTFGDESTYPSISNLYSDDTTVGFKAKCNGDGFASSITLYCAKNTYNDDARAFLYNHSDNTLVTNAVSEVVGVTSADFGWVEFAFPSSVNVVSGTTYYISFQQDGNMESYGLRWRYLNDAGLDEDHYVRDNDHNNHFPNYTSTLVEDFTNHLYLSIYCTYDEAPTDDGTHVRSLHIIKR